MSLNSSKLITTQAEFLEVLRGAKEATDRGERAGLDYEGTGLYPVVDEVVGLSISYGDNAWYAPIKHVNYPDNLTVGPVEIVLLVSIPWIAFSSAYERKFSLKQWKIILNIVGDASLLSKMMQWTHYNLNSLAEYLGLGGKPIALKQLTEGNYNFGLLDPREPMVLNYATRDSWLGIAVEGEMVKKYEIKRLEGKYTNWREIYNIELGTQQVLAEMETYGVPVDEAQIRPVRDALGAWIDKEQEAIHALIGTEQGKYFKINSHAKLGAQLFENPNGPQLKGEMRTKTGWSCSIPHLEMIEDQAPDIIKRLMEWKHQFHVLTRDMNKVESWLKQGRVFPDFQTVGYDATARIYASDPSITQFSKELRKLIQPGDDRMFCHWDWRQGEPRILAIASEDPAMLEIFNSGKDPYKQIAARLFKVEEAAVTKDQRETAKTILLAYMYGTYGYSVARLLKTTMETAKGYLADFATQFPKFDAFYKENYSRQYKDGDAYTILGRRRSVLIEMLKNKRNPKARAALARSNANFVGQSSCGGDLLKQAMINIYNDCKQIPELSDSYIFCPVFDAAAYTLSIAAKEKFQEIVLKNARYRLQKAADGYVRPVYRDEDLDSTKPYVWMEVEIKWSDKSWAEVI